MNARTTRRRRDSLRPVEPGEYATDPSGIPIKQIRCRAGHHKFALDDWEPPEPIPGRGVTVMFASEGRYKLLEPCLVCLAATRVTYTHPGGSIDGFLKSSITYGKNWRKMAMDAPRGRRLMRDERCRRGKAQLDVFIGATITSLADEAREEEPETSRASGVPPVVLRSV